MPWKGPSYTQVELIPITNRIRYEDQVAMLGSCFTTHIAARMQRYKYKVLENPFGILYHPAALLRSLSNSISEKKYAVSDLVFQDDLYHSPDHHGSFSGTDPQRVVNKINQSSAKAKHFFIASRYFLISPGTSIGYRLKASQELVGNCHKLPHDRFEKERLTVKGCIDIMQGMHDLITTISPDAKIVWTISPVRHIRDGLIENQRSKSVLHLAIEEMTKSSGHFYFPAYEIMIDQMRDYRYYAKDLIHPSTEAVDIIWDLFREHYLDQKEITIHPAIEKIKLSQEHRFLHHRPEAIQAFAKSNLQQITSLESQSPGLDWSEEKNYFSLLTETIS